MIHKCVLAVAVVVGCALGGTAEPASPDSPQATSVRHELSQRSEIQRGFKWGYSLFVLANEPNVQDELHLSQEQAIAIRRLADEYLDRLRTFATDNRQLVDGKPHETNADQMRDKAAILLAETGDSVIRILTPVQQQRLEQIAFQLCGFEVLRYREIIESLKLNDAQRSRIADLREWLISECQKEHVEHVQKRHDVSGFRKEVDRILSEARRQAIDTFTPVQRQLFESMEGPKIRFGRQNLKMVIRKTDASSRVDSRVENERPSASPLK